MTKRLLARLTAIEKNQGDTELSESARRLLVSLMGRLDALCWPFRENAEFRSEVRRLQKDWLSGVGGFRASGQGESSWKSAHHDRNELIGAGLVSSQVEGGQVTALRLTPQGQADARAMVGDRLHSLQSEPVAIVLELLRRREGSWVVENDLFGSEICVGTDPSEWGHAIDWMLPLLRCGAAESTSDSWHRCYFRFVDGVELPIEPASNYSEAIWGDACYLAAYAQERSALVRLESDGGVFIPHRCT